MFIDQVTIRVEGGVGGSGAEAFRRESGVPRGGPSGGDGGDGGDVILVADEQLSTLLDFRYHAEYRGERGQHGEGGNRTGRSGESRELRAPPGTVVRDTETGEVLGELLEPGQRLVVARGGRGGRGNARFATATNQAPRRWEPGAEGESRTVELTLKLIADVGLVGEPNAGKSTFLSSVSAARPKVADYPFTTLSPNLGVVQRSDFRSFVVADLPGIIEGAHEGRGLGHQFLRHIERTRTLALMVPVDAEDPQETYEKLRAELAQYSPELAERPHCLVLTKADLLSGEEAPAMEAPEAWGVFLISAVTRQGVDELLDRLWTRVRDLGPIRPEEGAGETLSSPGREDVSETEVGGRNGSSLGPSRGEDPPEEDWWGVDEL
ncbi:MAG: GTPase ObgE [Gemmatimonadales bacterium]|nr:MAG: GTPase ObgE [Gemmatimonadales bacterium]